MILSNIILTPNNLSENSPTIRIGIQKAPHLSLIKIALANEYFKQQGLNIEINEFTSGKFALQGLIGGSLDLITPAELPVTLATLNGENLSIITNISKSKDGFPLVVRGQYENFEPKNYFQDKRKIATSIGGGPEFFIHDFFKKYNIRPEQYELINMKPADMPIALANNHVDGIAIFEPFAQFGVQQTGDDKTFIFKDTELYSETLILVAQKDWAEQNQANITKFLKALKEAQEFIKNNPEKSIKIMADFTQLDKETLQNIWTTFSFELG